MFTASYIVAASQLFAIAFGAPLVGSSPSQARSLVERTAYKVFGGNGTPAQGWPQQSEWVKFEDAWKANEPTMMKSCTQFQVPNNTPDETAAIKTAIKTVAKDTSIPAEFLLAVVMQESKGCVRAWTTNYGFDNPGLMQSFQGTHSCNKNTNTAPTGAQVTTPCPDTMILGMIQDGAGVGLEAGLTQSLRDANAKFGANKDVSQYYKAARVYNSGSVASDNLGAGIATHCYSSDIANRLIGWTDASPHGCDEATIGSAPAGAPNSAPAGGDTTTTPPAGGDDGATTGTTPVDTTTPPPPPPAGGDSQPTGEKFPGAAAGCKTWYTVKSGDGCASTGVDMATLTTLNVGLNADCSNLWLGASYCTAA